MHYSDQNVNVEITRQEYRNNRLPFNVDNVYDNKIYLLNNLHQNQIPLFEKFFIEKEKRVYNDFYETLYDNFYEKTVYKNYVIELEQVIVKHESSLLYFDKRTKEFTKNKINDKINDKINEIIDIAAKSFKRKDLTLNIKVILQGPTMLQDNAINLSIIALQSLSIYMYYSV